MLFGDVKKESVLVEFGSKGDTSGGKVEKEVEGKASSPTEVETLRDIDCVVIKLLPSLSLPLSLSFSFSLSLTLPFASGGLPLLAPDTVTAPPALLTPTLPLPLLHCPPPAVPDSVCACVWGDDLSLTLPTGRPRLSADVNLISPSLLSTHPSLLSTLRLFDPFTNAKRNCSSSSTFCSFFDIISNSSRDCKERTFLCIPLIVMSLECSLECSSSLSSDKNVSTNSEAVLECSKRLPHLVWIAFVSLRRFFVPNATSSSLSSTAIIC